MRISHLSFFLILAILPSFAVAQQNGLDAALAKGNVNDMGIYFSKSIDLVIPGAEDTYTADKAVTILSDFFATEVVKGYKQVHLSAPAQGRSKYSIGDLYTSKGTYRITLYYDTEQKITEIRIAK